MEKMVIHSYFKTEISAVTFTHCFSGGPNSYLFVYFAAGCRGSHV